MGKSYSDGLIGNFEEETKQLNENNKFECKNEKITGVRNLIIIENSVNLKLKRGIALAAGLVGRGYFHVNIVANQLLAKIGVFRTDKGRIVDYMSDEELEAYIRKYNVSLEQVRVAVSKKLWLHKLYSDQMMEEALVAFEEARRKRWKVSK